MQRIRYSADPTDYTMVHSSPVIVVVPRNPDLIVVKPDSSAEEMRAVLVGVLEPGVEWVHCAMTPQSDNFSLVGSAASPATRPTAGPQACEHGPRPASTAHVGGHRDRTRSAQSPAPAPALGVLPRPERPALAPLRASDRGAEIRGKTGLPALPPQLQLRIRARNT